MKKRFAILTVLLAAALTASALPALIPLPRSVVAEEGAEAFRLSPDSAVVSCSAFAREAALAASQLRPATGYALPMRTDGKVRGGDIVFRKSGAVPAGGYRLTTDDGIAVITASDRAGVFAGYQTLRQLLPPQIYAAHPHEGLVWHAPAVTIEDSPRFAWRGLHLDESRHFMGTAVVKKLLDAMAAHKLNVLHWHLTDDQGWRIEIRKYPDLTRIGARRDSSATMWDRWVPDGVPYGPYYYTQEQIREIVAYAAERHITVVPEIDMPGHMRALLSAYPEMSCTGGPFGPRWMWGIDEEIVCAGNDAAVAMMKDILDEVAELFPSEYIHIGGDEAPKTRWNACPKCQARIRAEGLRDAHHLQSWFIGTMARHLESRGRRAIGWDEILEGGLPQGTAVMSWRGTAGGIAAAKSGHRVVMTPSDTCYLNFSPGLGDRDPYEYPDATLTAEKVYGYNPTDGVPRAMQPYVIGIQGNLWTEYIWGRRDLEWKAWPRGAAIAEIGWTPQAQRDWTDFRRRAAHQARRYAEMGINAAPLE